MRKTIFVSLAAALALTGCGGSADKNGDGKITNEEAASEAKGAITPRAGQYETKVKLLEIEMPEVAGVDPAQMKKMMESAMTSTTKHCVSAEDAQNATKQMLQGPERENCSYKKFDVAGGNVDAEMSCPGPDGSTNTMLLSGQMTREGSSMVMTLDQAVPGVPGGGKSHLKMQVDSKRIGDCT